MIHKREKEILQAVGGFPDPGGRISFACVLWSLSLFFSFFSSPTVWGEVQTEKVSYMNLPNCYRISNGTVELIVTTDVGPRIIRYSFVGKENILGERPDISIPTEWGDYKLWGGHRLWTAPEAKPRSYAPDNTPVEAKVSVNQVELTQPVETQTKMQKKIVVELDDDSSRVKITHSITNHSPWTVELAPWAITIMNGGGKAIIPQEPHRGSLTPARPMSLWDYTNLGDPRWQFGLKYIVLKAEERFASPGKIGFGNRQSWLAYHRAKTLFVKRFDYAPNMEYPDYGSNCEVYSDGAFVELESLGPLTSLTPAGTVTHVERWFLFDKVDMDDSDSGLDASIKPLVESTSYVMEH